MTILYQTSLRLYLLASRIAAPFSNKAALFYKGRKGLLNHIEQVMSSAEVSKGTRYWIHCASVGEFEQARPLIEKIKEQEPHSYIVITFFSPSGYELRKNYSLASAVFYLPIDTKANARRFVEYVKPDVAIFIKYEFWRNYLSELKKQKIPLYLVSAIFRTNQPFFKWWGANFRKMLGSFTHFFVQDSQSETLLRSIGITNVSVAGDTRFDRVFEITQNSKTIAALEVFVGDVAYNEKSNPNLNDHLAAQTKDHTTGQIVEQNNAMTANQICCIAGSTWPPDQELLLNFIKLYETSGSNNKDLISERAKKSVLKLIIAPHEVGESHIKKIESLFAAYKVVKFSDFPVVNEHTQTQTNNLTQQNPTSLQQHYTQSQQDQTSAQQYFTSAQIEKLSSAQIFIVDTVGILSTAYRYGNFAYVGGGFGVGIHNILEAATYGLPVVFGPKYQKFKEAKDLISLGGAFSVVSKDETCTLERLSLDSEYRKHCSQICRDYVQTNIGATASILKEINDF